MDDILSLLDGDDASADEKSQMLSAALRRQRALGLLGQLTGDKVLSGVGEGLSREADQQERLLMQVPEMRARLAEERSKRDAMNNPATARVLKSALAKLMPEAAEQLDDVPPQVMQQMLPVAERAFAAQRRGAMTSAAIDPQTLIGIRPDVVAALGGEDVVLGMEPMQLGIAVKAYDAKQGTDYKKDALTKRTEQQGAKTSVLQQALGIRERAQGVREKKLGLDIGGRAVPGMEMADGYVMQPKEAAAAKTLQGNVQRALEASDALKADFAQYGGDRLASFGGVLPTEALARMKGNRARLLEAGMQLQGVNPTIGHQMLLESQLWDPSSFQTMNHGAYLAQIGELEKSIKQTLAAFAAGHGVKKLSPLQQPEGFAQQLAAPVVDLPTRIGQLKAQGLQNDAIKAQLKKEGLVK